MCSCPSAIGMRSRTLLYGVGKGGRAFRPLTGEVGTGTTTLSRLSSNNCRRHPGRPVLNPSFAGEMVEPSARSSSSTSVASTAASGPDRRVNTYLLDA